MKRELKATLTEVRKRYRKVLRELIRDEAPNEQIEELEQELRDLVKHHTDEFTLKLDALVDGLNSDDSSAPPPVA